MSDTPSDHFLVTAVMLTQQSQHPWGEDLLSLLGILPGLPKSEITLAQQQGTVSYWPDLQLQLYPLHCDSYYHNLMSPQPKIYLVCQQDEAASMQPLVITVDYDEAASYMETGEVVVNATLPAELCVWLERFVLAHYQPEKQKNRRRQKWHDAETKP